MRSPKPLLLATLLLASCAEQIHPVHKKTMTGQNAMPQEGVAVCLNPKAAVKSKDEPEAAAVFEKVAAEEIPVAAIGGDIEALKAALKRQQTFCADPKRVPKTPSKFGSCELSPAQWCAGVGHDFLDMVESSTTMAELAAKAREKFDWYQFHGSKGKKDFLFTGYYSPLFEASRVRTEEFRIPVYAKPPELESVPDPANPSKRVWRSLNLDGKFAPYLKNQEISLEQMAKRNLVIAYLKDPTQPIDLKIEGAGSFHILEADGSYKTAFINYAAGNGHQLRTPARVMRCLGYPRSVWGTQKRVFSYLRGHEEELNYVQSWDPSHVFYEEEAQGPFGVGPFLLTPEVSIATDPSFLPTGVLALYSVEAESEDHSAPGKVQKTRFAVGMDVGGAIKNAHVDIFTGFGEKALDDTERLSGSGSIYVPVPKGCGTL